MRDLYAALNEIRKEGTAIVLVEQDVSRALKFADYAFCMLEGRISLEGVAGSLTPETIKRAYFGV